MRRRPQSISCILTPITSTAGLCLNPSPQVALDGLREGKGKEINKLDSEKYKPDGKKGLILEADLEYQQELHNSHDDYPVAPEKIKVSNGMLSEYCKKIAEKYKISIGQVNKLILTLRDKEECLLHYRNLQLYMALGLKVKKVHLVLEFDQSPWLKQYIDLNTEKRKHAENPFEKDFFKLMNNSVF